MNANPSTGVYSGPGVTGAFFSPSLAGAGVHTINYSYTDLNNCTTKAAVSVTVSSCEAIAETRLSTIRIFPNPSKGDLRILAHFPVTCELYNAIGQLLGRYELDTSNNYSIKLEQLPPSVYIIKFKSANEEGQYKFLVER
jgi:hypothetical protein